jgi:hypothetical protein
MAMDYEDTLVIFTIWETLLRAHDFVKDPQYAEFVSVLNRLCQTFPTITHTEIESQGKDLKQVMSAPCIELAPLTLQKDRVGVHYQNFKKAGKLVAAAPGNVAQFQNNQVENPFTQWSLVAWESMKVRMATIS